MSNNYSDGAALLLLLRNECRDSANILVEFVSILGTHASCDTETSTEEERDDVDNPDDNPEDDADQETADAADTEDGAYGVRNAEESNTSFVSTFCSSLEAKQGQASPEAKQQSPDGVIRAVAVVAVVGVVLFFI